MIISNLGSCDDNQEVCVNSSGADGLKLFCAHGTPAPEPGETIAIVSGFFGPVHHGHLDYIEAASLLGDKVCAIVNNNVQQVLKKQRVITDEAHRLRIVSALRPVDYAVIALDQDPTVCLTLEKLAILFSQNRLIFTNGGDRDKAAEVPETQVCDKYGIDMFFDTGGNEKADSSSRLIEEHEL